MSQAPNFARPAPEDVAALRASGEFDEAWYLSEYPDVALTRMDPAFHYLWLGQRLGRQSHNMVSAPATAPQSDYIRWIAQHDTITPADIDAMKTAIVKWTDKPTFSIIMPVYNTPEDLLCEAIESVLAQAYPHWELCIADDCSPKPQVRRILEEYSSRDRRIKVIYRDANGHISEASNSALSIASGEWYALMDHDDLLPPHALYCMAHAITKNPDVKLLYSDEDKISQSGQREEPYFKSDFNLELFRSHNMISHFGVYHESLVNKLGGFRSKFNGSQDYDLALRCIELIRPEQIHHVPRVLYHWRKVEGSTSLSNEEKPYAMVAGERALNAHYERMGIDAVAELTGFGYRTRYFIAEKPLVSIIIPTRNAKELVKKCIESILLHTKYNQYEIVIIDNGSDDRAAVSYFHSLSINPQIKLFRDDGPFNYSALNNKAAAHCDGEILVLLNNDTEVISSDWLEVLVSHVMQDGVGAVGPKLLYADGRVQHAGVVLGLGGVAGHVHYGFQRDEPGFFGRLGLTNEFSAISAACLAVTKDNYLAVGGLNDIDLAVAFNDVDFCLKLRKRGLRNIFTPYAELFHSESATRASDNEDSTANRRFKREEAHMFEVWGGLIANDPAYNPNLTIDTPDFALSSNPRLEKVW